MTKSAKCESVPSGNTKTDGKKPIENAVYRWFFTLREDKNDLCQLWQMLKEISKKFNFQLEEGEGGYRHYQGCFSLKERLRRNGVKDIIGYHDIHLEHCKNWYAALKYTSKDHTKIAGPWDEDKKPIKIVEKLRLWQQSLADELDSEPDDRKIIWYYDEIGKSGKTVFCKWLMYHRNAMGYTCGGYKDIAHAYNYQKIVCFNYTRALESDDHINYSAIESLKDGLMFSSKYESGCKIFDSPHVVIFSNKLPDFSKLSMDRWDIRILGDDGVSHTRHSTHLILSAE